MFVTILRGQVAQENWGELQHQYERLLKSLPDRLLQTYLVQNHEHGSQWHIISFWKSEADFNTAQHDKKTEACVNLFCDAGTIPERVSFHVRRGYHRV